jgi:hypothetical protein
VWEGESEVKQRGGLEYATLHKSISHKVFLASDSSSLFSKQVE